MKCMDDHSPLSMAIYYASVTAVLAFNMNPILIGLALLGAAAYLIKTAKRNIGRSALLYSLFFLLMVVINPIISHKGVTVLFVVNDSPITLESFIYGCMTAGTVIAVLCLFRSFTRIMTSDKLLSVFSFLSPKLALVLSMAIRYIPLFGRQAKKIEYSQKALGIYKDENVIDRVRAKVRIFSALITWALECGIITANSMSARGYGSGKRSSYVVYKNDARDIAFIAITLCLLAVEIAAALNGATGISYYPNFVMTPPGALTYAAYASYAILSLMPIIFEIREDIRWKYLESKI